MSVTAPASPLASRKVGGRVLVAGVDVDLLRVLSVHVTIEGCPHAGCNATLGQRFPCDADEAHGVPYAPAVLRVQMLLYVTALSRWYGNGWYILDAFADVLRGSDNVFGFPQRAAPLANTPQQIPSLVLQDTDGSGNQIYSLTLWTGCLNTAGSSSAFAAACNASLGAPQRACAPATDYSFTLAPIFCSAVNFSSCASAPPAMRTRVTTPWTVHLVITWQQPVPAALGGAVGIEATAGVVSVSKWLTVGLRSRILPAWTDALAGTRASDFQVLSSMRRAPWMDYAGSVLAAEYVETDILVDEQGGVWMREVLARDDDHVTLALSVHLSTDERLEWLASRVDLHIVMTDASLCGLRPGASTLYASCMFALARECVVDCGALLAVPGATQVFVCGQLHGACNATAWTSYTQTFGPALAGALGVPAAIMALNPVAWFEPLWADGAWTSRVLRHCRSSVPWPPAPPVNDTTPLANVTLDGNLLTATCAAAEWCGWYPFLYHIARGGWDGLDLSVAGLPFGVTFRVMLKASIFECPVAPLEVSGSVPGERVLLDLDNTDWLWEFVWPPDWSHESYVTTQHAPVTVLDAETLLSTALARMREGATPIGNTHMFLLSNASTTDILAGTNWRGAASDDSSSLVPSSSGGHNDTVVELIIIAVTVAVVVTCCVLGIFACAWRHYHPPPTVGAPALPPEGRAGGLRENDELRRLLGAEG